MERTGSWRRISWLGLAALAALPYLGSLRFPLLYDDRTLLDNPWLHREATPPSIFSHDFWYGTRHAGSDLYRPLTILTLAANLRWAGTRAGFRLGNVALHVLVTWLVAWTLRATIRAPAPHGESPLRARAAAWMGAALFAVHPLASEAVLWAVGRAELLAAGCGLAAFCLLAGSPDSAHRGARLTASVVLFFLAMLSKESAASWLPIGLAWLLLTRRPRAPGSGSQWLGAVGWFLALFAFLLLRGNATGWWARTPHWLDNPLVLAAPPARLANAVFLHGRYLAKMVFPLRLSVDYGYDQLAVVGLLPWGGGCAIALVAAWIAALVLLKRLSAPAAFLWCFLPAAFLVTGNFLLPIGTIFAERLAYLPLVGMCGLASLGLALLRPRFRLLVLILLLVLLLTRTIARTRDYRDLSTFAEATAAASPRSVKALVNLGRTRLELLGRASDALGPLERAVALWPDYPRALHLLSKAHAELGHQDLALTYERLAREAEARSFETPSEDMAR